MVQNWKFRVPFIGWDFLNIEQTDLNLKKKQCQNLDKFEDNFTQIKKIKVIM